MDESPFTPPSPTHSKDEGGEQDASADVAVSLLGLVSNGIRFNDDVDDDEGAQVKIRIRVEFC